MRSSPVTLVLTTLPDQESARQLARLLVEKRLAACVNVLAPCHSVYHWQGALQENGEIPLIIKTTPERYNQLEAFLSEHHPYETPEILALDPVQGLPDYLAWVTRETQP
ncbi:MAG: divalent-cation tolerance protein CutA [Hydrogenophilales bacterium]|nr:divalent-cation tolerance protein CutA [Hydrogenophilales bacterium]